MAKTQFLYMYIVKPYYVLIYDQTWYPYEGLKIIKHHSRMGVGGGGHYNPIHTSEVVCVY